MSSRISRKRRSFARVLRTSSSAPWTCGSQPHRRATDHASRSYHAMVRCVAPMSWSSVLISITRSALPPGWKAITSIQPRTRSVPISTSCSTTHPSRSRFLLTEPEQRLWAGSRWRIRSMRNGASAVTRTVNPSVSSRVDAFVTERLPNLPVSIRQIVDWQIPERSLSCRATAAQLRTSSRQLWPSRPIISSAAGGPPDSAS